MRGRVRGSGTVRGRVRRLESLRRLAGRPVAEVVVARYRRGDALGWRDVECRLLHPLPTVLRAILLVVGCVVPLAVVLGLDVLALLLVQLAHREVLLVMIARSFHGDGCQYG